MAFWQVAAVQAQVAAQQAQQQQQQQQQQLVTSPLLKLTPTANLLAKTPVDKEVLNATPPTGTPPVVDKSKQLVFKVIFMKL